MIVMVMNEHWKFDNIRYATVLKTCINIEIIICPWMNILMNSKV